MAAVGLGISVTSIPYVLKMADFSQTVGQDGKVSNEKLTEALNKVLEDIPALKPQETEGLRVFSVSFCHSGLVFLCPNTSKAINCSVTGDTEDNGSQ